MDVVGGIHLAGGVEVKCVTGIDDNSRFIVSAMLVARARARARPVCEALLAALRRHGVPEGVLTGMARSSRVGSVRGDRPVRCCSTGSARRTGSGIC